MRLTGVLGFLLVLGAVPTPTLAQRLADAKTGPSRPALDSMHSTRIRPDSIARPRAHPTMSRILSGVGLGVGVGLGGMLSGLCLSADPCNWNIVNTGVVGYWLGGVIGTASVKAERCPFRTRLGRALVGSIPGTAVGYGVAVASHMSKDLAAFAATTVVALAPIVSSAVVLRTCD